MDTTKTPDEQDEQQVTCAYCRAVKPVAAMFRGTIILYNSKVKENWYCKDRSCRGNDQMAHEG